MSVVVVGSVALDTVKTPMAEIKRGLGGSAIHFSNAASVLEKVKLVGIVGEDYPQEGIAFCHHKGIDIEGLEKAKGKTFHWEGYYKGDMSEAITVNTELNVFAEFSPKIPESYRNEEFLFLANMAPTLQFDVLNKMKNLKLSVMDTMNFWIESQKDNVLDVMRHVDIALLNDAEALMLSGMHTLKHAAEWLLKLGLKYVVIKKGANGAIVMGKDEYFVCPAYPVDNVVDPTGAGDSFAGGLVSYIAHKGTLSKESLREAMIYATAVASFNVEAISIEGLYNVTPKNVQERVDKILEMIRVGEIKLDA